MHILIVLFFVAISLVYIYLKRRYYTDPNDGIPGLPPEFLFGHSRSTGLLSGEAICVIFNRLQRRFGDVFTYWWGSKRSIVLNRVEHVQYVLSNRHIYEQGSIVADGFGLIAPSGLISLQGQAWKRHARFILPMFKRAKITHFIDTITRCADEFIHSGQLIDNCVNKKFTEQFNRLFLKIFEAIAFDYDPSADTSSSSSSSSSLSSALADFMQESARAMLAAGLPRFLQHLFLRLNRKYQQARAIVHYHVLAIINQELSRIEPMDRKPNTLIESLVSSLRDDGLTKEELFDEVVLFIVAGTETSSSALAWFVYFASKNPSVQEQIKMELRQHNVTVNTPLTGELLDKLVYVECVIKEVLRHAPIAAGIARNILQDDEIGKGIHVDDMPAIRVRAGDMIYIMITNLHHDPRYWNLDPQQFLPERFLGEDCHHHPYAFLPFGGGHRACAGRELAFFELKTIITRLMQFLTFIDCNQNTGGYQQKTMFSKKFGRHRSIR
ncbi:unnamed protein product [Rotaria sordida]|uniref:Cytochrome P450 n=1 Tax=Rotaria sordida TaxID=392033 RepID=A0A815BKW5_9BILA|nr:unnamed protein product [Rotaria sordida]CAF3702194.1 unnamed protein product [Rotaria sordida]